MASRIRKTLLWSLAATPLLLAGMAVGGYLWLQGESGRGWLAGAISDLASSPDARLELTGLSGSIPFDMRAERLSLADAKGVWLQAAGIEVSISGSALFDRRLEIGRLGASEVQILREPLATDIDDEVAAPPTSSGVVDLPVDIDLQEARIDQIVLFPPLLGDEAAAFHLDAKAAVDRNFDEVAAELKLVRVDRDRDSLAANLAYEPAENRLVLEAKLREGAGGLIGHLTGLPAEAPLALDLDGKGTLADWTGKIKSASTGFFDADFDLAVTRASSDSATSAIGLDLKGRATVTGLLPMEVRAALQGPFDLEASFAASPELRKISGKVNAHHSRGRLSLDGKFASEDAEFELVYVLKLADSAGLERALPDIAWRSALLSGKAQGQLESLSASARLEVTAPSFGDLSAEHLDLATSLAPDKTDAGYTYQLELSASALSHSEAALPIRGPGTTRFQSEGVFDLDTGNIVVRSAKLIGALGHGEAHGEIENWGESVDADTTIEVADLSQIAPLLGVDLNGRMHLTTNIETDGSGTRAVTELTGGEISWGDAYLDTLLGARPTVKSSLATEDWASWEVTALEISGASLHGSARGRLTERDLNFDIDAGLNDLSELSEAVGLDITGTASLTGKIKGDMANPVTTLRIEIPEGTLEGENVSNLIVSADHLRLEAVIAGALSLEGNYRGAEVRLGTDMKLEDDLLSFETIRASTAGIDLSGNASVDLESTILTGKFTASSTDLAKIGKLLALQLSGQGSAKIEILPEKGDQGMALDLELASFALGSGDEAIFAGNVSGSARIKELHTDPIIDSRTVISNLQTGDVAVEVAELTMAGPLTAIDAALDARGGLDQEFQVSALGRLTEVATQRPSLELSGLSGNFGRASISLNKPVRISSDGRRHLVEDLDVSFDGARLAASLSLAPDALNVTASIRDLQLSSASLLLSEVDLQGVADAELNISGPPSAPIGEFSVTVSDLNSLGPDAESAIPPVSFKAAGKWRDRRLATSASIGNPESLQDLAATLELPLVISPQGYVPSIDQTAAISGRIDGTVELSAFNDFLAAGGQSIRGTLFSSLTIGGSLTSPRLGGEIRLTEGRYRNFESGTDLRQIAAVATASNERLKITSFDAVGPEGGRFEGSGELDISSAPPRLDLSLRSQGSRLVSTDIVSAKLSTDIWAKGPIDDLRVGGEVTIEQAEIRVPERLPPTVIELDVREKGVEPEAQSGDPQLGPSTAKGTSSNVELDIKVRAANQVYVRGRGLDAEMGGEFTLGGSLAEPRVDGGLTMRRGTFDFLSRQFVFSKGSVAFLDDGELDPELDFEAIAEEASVRARVTVTGQASNPKIAIDSADGSLPQDEVLSRLLFGKGVGQLTALEAVRLVQSAAVLGGVETGPGILDRLRGELGVDRLEFVSDGEGASGAGVAAGKYVTDKVYLGVQQGAGQDSSKVRVEIEVTDDISVESDVGADAQGSVGVRWKYDY